MWVVGNHPTSSGPLRELQSPPVGLHLEGKAMSGSQNGTPWVDADATSESREDAEHFLKVGVEVHGTPAEVYLRDVRRIDPPFPEDWRYVEDARTGEGALLAPLYFDGRA